MGLSFERINEQVIKKKVVFNDDQTEAKLFPHLFPHGTGYFINLKDGMTHAKYFRMRLLNIDPRWRNDRFYLFYAYDYLTKERLLTVNNMVNYL